MIVIQDVHGLPLTLKALMAKCPEDPDGFAFVGDLIDRGPGSREVVSIVKDGGWPCVMGNHEHMAIDEIYHGDQEDRPDRLYDRGLWLFNGGVEGVMSYINDDTRPQDFVHREFTPENDIFVEHMEWFKTLPLYLDFPNVRDENGRGLFVSHSAVRPYGPLTVYDLERFGTEKAFTNHHDLDNSVIWYRGTPAKLKDRFHIFGHTPRKKPDIQEYYAMIDTGAIYNRGKSMFMTALQYPSMKVVQQANIDTEYEPENIYS